MDALAVRLTGITKRFGPVLANDGVDLSVRAGTVHGLVGENGAGKSTLMSVLYGFYTADRGEIALFGKTVTIRNAHEAIAHGIGMVHQHFMLVDTLNAIENVMLGAEPHPLLARADRIVRAKLEALMASTGLKVALDATVGTLSVGDRQRLEILKTLYRGARVLILDEPTAVLTPQETGQLFEVLARLRSQGTTILLITHKLKEVMRLCDTVTVMRAGRVVADRAIGETSIDALAEAMVGRRLGMTTSRSSGTPIDPPGAFGATRERPDAGPGRISGKLRGGVPVALAPMFEATGLVVRDALGVVRLRGVDLRLCAGEIVGVAGVAGNGQSELLDVLSGLRAPDEGRLAVGGEHFEAPRWFDPRIARRLRIAHVPEDRHARAMVMSFKAWESAVLGYEGLPVYSSRFGWMRPRRIREATAALMTRFDVRPPNPDLVGAKFSGGNQQKLVLARELGQAPRVLLVGQPTRGVDIGAIEFIHAQLRALRDAGAAVLVVSSELDEVLALADRVVVMNDGRITGELPVGDCDEVRLGRLMTETEPA